MSRFVRPSRLTCARLSTASRSRPTTATVMPRSSWQTAASSLCRKAGDQPRSTRSRCTLIRPMNWTASGATICRLSTGCRLLSSCRPSCRSTRSSADIKQRLITSAQTPLANLREFAKQLERDGRPLEMIGRAYAAQFPELEITVPELSDHRGSIRGGAPVYLLGDFYSDGCVSIERMELTRAQFERVVRVLREGE